MSTVDAGPSHQASDALKACAAQQAQAVPTIAAAVDRLNALPEQSVACFVASLPRPLDVVGTLGRTSAQPAAGPESPRLFLLASGLVSSVVGSGDGAHLIELGQWVTNKRTLKGEISLPFMAPLAANAPFTRVLMGGGSTSCGLCHRFETPDPSMNGGFVSVAFKPASDSEVSLKKVAALHDACVASSESGARCDLLHALFDLGEVRQGAFAPEVERFIP